MRTEALSAILAEVDHGLFLLRLRLDAVEVVVFADATAQKRYGSRI